MTRPHINRLTDVGSGENGAYSIKVGRRVPDDAVNLAYVSSPKISIDENISLVDKSVDIVENTAQASKQSEKIMISDENFLLSDEQGNSNMENSNILITDEFSIGKDQLKEVSPLYYETRLPGYFYTDDIKSLSVYISGYHTNPSNLGGSLDFSQPLLYTGSKIQITEQNEAGLDKDKAFKIKLVPIKSGIHPEDINKVFSVYLYTNFRNGNGKTYKVNYPMYNISKRQISENTEHVLSAAPIFEKKDISYIESILNNPTDESLQESVYSVKSSENYYNIYAPSKMITATENSRPPARFKYKVLANLTAQYSESNPHTVKIGIVYQENQPEGESLADILCGQLTKGDVGLPSYIDIDNPHPMGSFYKYDERYWRVDLNMPNELFMDYDIIILTGYGDVDLSLYAEKFHTFLDNGGKLIVDNLTNSPTGRFYLNINNSDYTIMDIGCTGSSSPIDGNLQAGEEVSLFSEYHMIEDTNYNQIRHEEDGTLVSPPISFGPKDSDQNWTFILQYEDGRPALLYKKYRQKGTIFFSNCGFLRKYRSSTEPGVEAEFLINIIMNYARDLYVTTPWLYSHVYHRHNLFSQEYIVNGKTMYIDDVTPSGLVVAKKILAPTTRAAILPHIDSSLYNAPGLFYIQYESDRNIQMTSKNDGSEMLYAYAVDPQPYSFTPTEAGYKDSDVKVINEKVEFNYIIRAFTYRWENDGENILFRRQDGPYATYKGEVRRSDGVVNLGPFVAKLPPLPKGEIWADTSKIFFELIITSTDANPLDVSNNKVNIGIYDKRLGRYYYNKNSQNIIPYRRLYEYRHIEIEDSDGTKRTIHDMVANDLVVQAFTNHYTISAKSRTFAVRSNTEEGIIRLEMPRYTDERKKWHVKIQNGGFKKTRYTQNDYETYARLIKYRYDDLDFFEDDIPPVFPNKVLEYSINPQFRHQAFNGPIPFRRSIDEKAAFVNEYTIGVNNSPLYIQDFTVEDETLVQIDSKSFKANNGAWVESKDVTIKGESSPGVFVVIDPSLYTIDYRLGIVKFIAEFGTEYKDKDGNTMYMQDYLSVRSTYTCLNIYISKKRYNNQLTKGELLKRQSDSKTFIISKTNIATHPSPKLYNDSNEVYPKDRYTVDYKNGVIKLKSRSNENLYLNYTFFDEFALTPSDYDIENGFIYLKDKVDFTDEVYVSYTYEERFLHYNGYFDGSIYHHLDLNPSEGHQITYSVVDDQDVKRHKLVPTSKVINIPIFIYMLPYRETSLITGEVVTNFNNIRHCFGEEQMAKIMYINPEAIILGIVQIKESAKVEDAIVLDTRVRGGGLKEDINQQDIDRVQPLANHHWDISTWHGIAYQSNAVSVIKLPNTVLKENGGTMTKNDIEGIIDKYAAYGTYQIIEYYEEED